MKHVISYILIPPLAISVLYLLFLAHRSDYAGHFMAGFGGTLITIMAIVELQRDREEAPSTAVIVLYTSLLCIAFGTLLEATTFRLAAFDEVDYANQSLGAVLAGLSSLAILPSYPEESPLLLPSLIIGFLFLFGGFYYAFR